MSYTIIHKCEWCGVEHNEYSRSITGHAGNNCDFKIGDLCGDCYGPLKRALMAGRAITDQRDILFNVWLASVLAAAALGAFICYVVRTL